MPAGDYGFESRLRHHYIRVLIIIKEIFCSKEYHVDECGIVYGKNGNPLRPSINPRGYQIVNLIINGRRKGFSVHTLVARAFCDGYEEGKQVNHKDGNKTNNNVYNLEWVTPKENVRHSFFVLEKNPTKSSRKAVFAFDKNTKELAFSFNSLSAAADFFKGTSQKKSAKTSIYKAIYNKENKKTYKGFIWSYSKTLNN